MPAKFYPVTTEQGRPGVRPILLLADLLMLAVMMCTFFAEEGTAAPLIAWMMASFLVLLYVPCHFLFRVRVAPEMWLFGLFIAWSLLSGMVVAVDEKAFLHYAMMLVRLSGLSLAVAGFSMAKRSSTNNFVIVAIWAVYLAVLVGLTGSYALGLGRSFRPQSGWSLGNPNTVGILTLWGIVGLAYLWETTNSRAVRLGIALLAPVAALALLSTASRKSFAGLFFFIAMWVVFCYGKRVIRSASALVTAGIVLVGMGAFTTYMVYKTQMGQRFESAAAVGGLGETRTGLYKRAWELFQDHPITGVGLGNFTTLSGFDLYAHSDYAEVLSTTGAVGFVLYFSIYPILWRRIVRVRKAAADPRTKRQMGVYQALLLTMLALAIGSPNFLSIYSWFLLATMIGHTHALSRPEPTASPAVVLRAVSPGSLGVAR